MRQALIRGINLRRRWWILPPAFLLVIGALVLRALTAPLSVSASVANGDLEVVRGSAIILTFNQDMDAASVRNGFRIAPAVSYGVIVRNPRTFEFKPAFQPDTQYRVQVTGAKKTTGFGDLTYSLSFHTEPAPKVAATTYNSVALTDGQQAVALRGNLALTFSQPMDAAHTPLLLDVEQDVEDADRVVGHVAVQGSEQLTADRPDETDDLVHQCRGHFRTLLLDDGLHDQQEVVHPTDVGTPADLLLAAVGRRLVLTMNLVYRFAQHGKAPSHATDSTLFPTA